VSSWKRRCFLWVLTFSPKLGRPDSGVSGSADFFRRTLLQITDTCSLHCLYLDIIQCKRYTHPSSLALSTRLRHFVFIVTLLIANAHLGLTFSLLPAPYLFRVYVSRILPAVFNCLVRKCRGFQATYPDHRGVDEVKSRPGDARSRSPTEISPILSTNDRASIRITPRRAIVDNPR